MYLVHVQWHTHIACLPLCRFSSFEICRDVEAHAVSGQDLDLSDP